MAPVLSSKAAPKRNFRRRKGHFINGLRGAALMVLAMPGFALKDMLIKLMATVLPVGQIRGVLGMDGAFFVAFSSLIPPGTMTLPGVAVIVAPKPVYDLARQECSR